MDASRFDGFTRSLNMLSTSGSRRATLHGLGAALIASAVGSTGRLALAGACSLKANGIRCSAGTECCSGRCVRKRGTRKKFCRRAPGQGTCHLPHNICAGDAVRCGGSGAVECACHVTARGFSACLQLNTVECRDCKTIDPCEAGEICIQCDAGSCDNTGNRGCVTPCPDPD